MASKKIIRNVVLSKNAENTKKVCKMRKTTRKPIVTIKNKLQKFLGHIMRKEDQEKLALIRQTEGMKIKKEKPLLDSGQKAEQ